MKDLLEVGLECKVDTAVSIVLVLGRIDSSFP